MLTMIDLFQSLLQAIESNLTLPASVKRLPEFGDSPVAFIFGLAVCHLQRSKIVIGRCSLFFREVKQNGCRKEPRCDRDGQVAMTSCASEMDGQNAGYMGVNDRMPLVL